MDRIAELCLLFCFQALGDKVISVTRLDKDVILFYNNPDMSCQVDEGEYSTRLLDRRKPDLWIQEWTREWTYRFTVKWMDGWADSHTEQQI